MAMSSNASRSRRSLRSTRHGFAVLSLMIALLASPALAEDPPSASELEALKNRIEKLEQEHRDEVTALRSRIAELEGAKQDDRDWITDEIEAEVRHLEERIEEAEAEDTEIERFNLFNPSVTVFGNFVGRLDDKDVMNDEGDNVSDRFNLREVEIDFRADIDPWTKGVVILTVESEAPGEFEALIEEGYVLFDKLPGLEESPLGLKVRAGRFRPQFGKLNLLHTHDLPWTTRPRSYQAFLGEEGFAQNGISGEFFVPTPGEDNALTANISWLNGGEIPLAEANGGEEDAWLGHLGWFFDLGDGHDVEVGGSGYFGKADESGGDTARLYGIDATYRWRPPGASQRRALVIGGEIYRSDVELDADDAEATGGFGWASYQFNSNWAASARYDWFEDPADDSMETNTASVFVSHNTTEFLRLRVGYERVLDSDVDEIDSLDTLLFELNFVFGAHPPHPYWANL